MESYVTLIVFFPWLKYCPNSGPTVAGQGNRIRDKETESPYLVHPLTYSQVYKIKEACFNVKISSVLLRML